MQANLAPPIPRLDPSANRSPSAERRVMRRGEDASAPAGHQATPGQDPPGATARWLPGADLRRAGLRLGVTGAGAAYGYLRVAPLMVNPVVGLAAREVARRGCQALAAATGQAWLGRFGVDIVEGVAIGALCSGLLVATPGGIAAATSLGVGFGLLNYYASHQWGTRDYPPNPSVGWWTGACLLGSYAFGHRLAYLFAAACALLGGGDLAAAAGARRRDRAGTAADGDRLAIATRSMVVGCAGLHFRQI